MPGGGTIAFGGGRGDGICSVGSDSSGGPLALLGVVGLASLVLVARRRRR
jgi:MYXO-CTERM domain-containing protein